MDNLTRNQIILHYLNVYLAELKSKEQGKSSFAYDFFTRTELHELRTHFNYPFDKLISDTDILAFVLSSWKQEQELSENPNEDYLKDMVHQLGLYGHYLDTKFIKHWDNYDYSNFNALKIKSGKAKYAYAIFTSDVKKQDIDDVCSLPIRWFSSLDTAQTKKEELMTQRGFKDEELKIYQDLRPI